LQYSSLQGRRIADLHAQQLGADAALVYFGWNDHWKAWGEPDAEKQIAMPGSRIGRLHALLLQRVRLVGFAQWLRDSLAGRQKRRSGGVRVPPDHYRENLAAIAETFRASGSEVFFLTAPSAHARLGTPGDLVDGGLVTREGEAVELHRRYNDITRGVAADRNVALVDLAAGMESLPDAELERLFRTDGIHFLPEGERWIAERVARALRASPVPSARVSADGEPSDLPHPRL
jgi:lysophospholipase L1-like esterase